MALRHHSRTFAALRAIADSLEAADWSPHPTTGQWPTVGVGLDQPGSIETVDVVHQIEDSAAIEWATIPAGRDERFTVDIVIRSSVPGVDRGAALDRLEGLAETAQTVFVDLTADQPYTPPTFDGVQPLGGVERVAPAMWRTDEGWVGECVITVRIAARI